MSLMAGSTLFGFFCLSSLLAETPGPKKLMLIFTRTGTPGRPPRIEYAQAMLPDYTSREFPSLNNPIFAYPTLVDSVPTLDENTQGALNAQYAGKMTYSVHRNRSNTIYISYYKYGVRASTTNLSNNGTVLNPNNQSPPMPMQGNAVYVAFAVDSDRTRNWIVEAVPAPGGSPQSMLRKLGKFSSIATDLANNIYVAHFEYASPASSTPYSQHRLLLDSKVNGTWQEQISLTNWMRDSAPVPITSMAFDSVDRMTLAFSMGAPQFLYGQTRLLLGNMISRFFQMNVNGRGVDLDSRELRVLEGPQGNTCSNAVYSTVSLGPTGNQHFVYDCWNLPSANNSRDLWYRKGTDLLTRHLIKRNYFYYDSRNHLKPSLIVDSNDVAHIAFVDRISASRSAVFYGNNRNGTWSVSRIDPTVTPNTLHSVQLALHPDDPSVAYIAYVDENLHQLRLARTKFDFTPWRVDSLNIEPGVDTLGRILIGN